MQALLNEADCKLVHDHDGSEAFASPLSGVLLHSVEQQQQQTEEVGPSFERHSVQRVCICGVGHGSHVMAALAASKGLSVTLFATRSSHLERFSPNDLTVSAFYTSENRTVTGTVLQVTTDPQLAAAGADLVLLCVPSFLHDSVLRDLLPHLPPSTPVGVVSGAWWGKPPLPGMATRTFFLMETLPWACRVERVQVGQHTATVLGTKARVSLGSSPASHAPALCELVGGLLEINFTPMPHLLCSVLFTGYTVHPGIMYGQLSSEGEKRRSATRGKETQELDQGKDNGRETTTTPCWKTESAIPLFYQGVDDFTEEVLLGLEADFLSTKARVEELLPSVDFSSVSTVRQWLLQAYPGQVGDSSTLGSALRTNEAYRGLVFPTKPSPTGTGRVPLFDYRYLTEDAQIHLMVVRGLAELLAIPTPTLDKVVLWAQARLGMEWLREGHVLVEDGKEVPESEEEGRGPRSSGLRAPQAFGIHTVSALLRSMQ